MKMISMAVLLLSLGVTTSYAQTASVTDPGSPDVTQMEGFTTDQPSNADITRRQTATGNQNANQPSNNRSSTTIDMRKNQTSAQPNSNFLDLNKGKKGVMTTSDGLQYRVLVDGAGPKPTQSDFVTVNYEGRLVSGKVFDSSYKRGEPATFPVSGVIPGWVEALTMMKQGSKWEVVIPPQLAYGEQGVPGSIGPNETLIFTIELVTVKKS